MHIDGVFAEYMAAPQDICVKLPDHASLEVGALLEAAGVAVHAIQRAGYAVAGRAVLVSGGGPVGLVVAYLAKLMGAAHVIVVEPNPYRRAQAQTIGALAMPPMTESSSGAVNSPADEADSTSPSSAPVPRPHFRHCFRPCAPSRHS